MSATATIYARALLELASEKSQAEAAGQELINLAGIFDSNPSLADVFHNPAISRAKRSELIANVFRNRVSPLLANFLGVLNNKNRIALLPDIARAYRALLDKQFGRVEVDVTVSTRLDDASLDQVRQRISTALNKTAIIRQKVDESIIGGLVLRIEDQLIDGSVKAQLQAMRKKLTSVARA